MVCISCDHIFFCFFIAVNSFFWIYVHFWKLNADGLWWWRSQCIWPTHSPFFRLGIFLPRIVASPSLKWLWREKRRFFRNGMLFAWDFVNILCDYGFIAFWYYHLYSIVFFLCSHLSPIEFVDRRIVTAFSVKFDTTFLIDTNWLLNDFQRTAARFAASKKMRWAILNTNIKIDIPSKWSGERN